MGDSFGRPAGPFPRRNIPAALRLHVRTDPGSRRVGTAGSGQGARRDNLMNARDPQPLSVLIVEDQPDVGDSLKIFLELCGAYEVTLTSDGEAGVAAALAGRPHAVVCDIGLPKKDGFQVAEELAAALPRTSLLIAVTGYGTRDVEDRARQAGFRHILVKPADPFEVEKLLREHRAKLMAGADYPSSQV